MSDFKSNNDLQQLHSVIQEAHSNPKALKKLIQTSRQQYQSLLPRVDEPEQTLPRVDKSSHALPRVESILTENQCITRAIAKQTTTASIHVQLHTSLLFVARKKKHTFFCTCHEHMNQGGRESKLAAPLALNTRSIQFKLHQPT
jgi:hypothetical protein